MHYLVNFLRQKRGKVLIEVPPNIAHFETDGGGMLPNIGDVIHIDRPPKSGRSSYQGTVTNRIFSYINAGSCEVSVVFEDHGGRNSD